MVFLCSLILFPEIAIDFKPHKIVALLEQQKLLMPGGVGCEFLRLWLIASEVNGDYEMQGRMGRDLFNLVMNYSVTYYYPHG
jgi:hypothetical protein